MSARPPPGCARHVEGHQASGRRGKLVGWPDRREYALGDASLTPPDFRANNSNRRRVAIFSAVFLVGCALSAAYAIFRPAEYRAVARLEIASPPNALAENGRKSFL